MATVGSVIEYFAGVCIYTAAVSLQLEQIGIMNSMHECANVSDKDLAS